MWLMFGYIETYKVKIVKKGPGGCEEIKKYINDDEIFFVVVKLTNIDVLAKYMIISLVGSKAKGILIIFII